jgi:hypothetical protein
MTFSSAQWRDLSWVDLFAGQFFVPQPSGFGSATIDDINVSAVPVPTAVWLFASALGMIGFARRRTVA